MRSRKNAIVVTIMTTIAACAMRAARNRRTIRD
jgi:hypothetical protein